MQFFCQETALKLLEQDIAEMDNVSKRWVSDMQSDSWLSKNTRPMTLIFLTLSMTIFIVLDSTVLLEIKDGWVSLLEALLITVYIAYFGSDTTTASLLLKGISICYNHTMTFFYPSMTFGGCT